MQYSASLYSTVLFRKVVQGFRPAGGCSFPGPNSLVCSSLFCAVQRTVKCSVLCSAVQCSAVQCSTMCNTVYCAMFCNVQSRENTDGYFTTLQSRPVECYTSSVLHCTDWNAVLAGTLASQCCEGRLLLYLPSIHHLSILGDRQGSRDLCIQEHPCI